LSATLTAGSIGSRSISVVGTPAAFSEVLGSASLTSSSTVAVAEVSVAGVNPWTVTATLAGAWSDGVGDTIPANALADTGNSTTVVNGAGSSAVDHGTTGTLDGSQTLVKTSGELTGTLYTGTYTTTTNLTLTPPNQTVAAPAGTTYANTLDVTLID